MTVVKVSGADLDFAQTGSGRNLVLPHSLLTDRSAFDLVVPELAAVSIACLQIEDVVEHDAEKHPVAVQPVTTEHFARRHAPERRRQLGHVRQKFVPARHVAVSG